MSRSASIDVIWADGSYTFRLGWGELAKLQEACDAGPYHILGRLQDGTWRIQDISGVIRLGLIGAGMAPADATRKVQSWVEDRPPMENLPFARAILSAALVGASDEKPGEDEAEDQERATPPNCQGAS